MSYVEARQRNIEEKKKKFEALNLQRLAHEIQKPQPLIKERKLKVDIATRRSERLANLHGANNVKPHISYEAREHALRKAEEIDSQLGSTFPSFVRIISPSAAGGVVWFPRNFCTNHLPRNDCMVTLVDEKGDEFDAKYNASRASISAGWRAFAVAHKLIVGDSCVFQLIKPTTFKVYIIRATDYD